MAFGGSLRAVGSDRAKIHLRASLARGRAQGNYFYKMFNRINRVTGGYSVKDFIPLKGVGYVRARASDACKLRARMVRRE